MKIIIILILIFLSLQISFAQKTKAPKNINEAIAILNTSCSEDLKTILKKKDNDELFDLYLPWRNTELYLWQSFGKKKSKIEKYLISNGISRGGHQITVILIAFKKHLLGEPVNEKEILEPYQKIENNWREEEKVKFTKDSLNGIYIPKDLDDCLKQLDCLLADSTKIEIKQWIEDEFIRNAYFSLGVWIRNNWGLWRGSRLSKYFEEMGFSHPDNMSGFILRSYHRYLRGSEIKLEE